MNLYIRGLGLAQLRSEVQQVVILREVVCTVAQKTVPMFGHFVMFRL